MIFDIDLDKFKRSLGLRELFLKTILPLKYPIILNIEPTNRCNLSCTFCPRKISKRKLADIQWIDFEKIAQEAADNGPIYKIFLQKDGEPLLHPKIVEMVQCLKSLNSARNVTIISNGTLLNGDLFTSLAKAGLNDIIISVDAVDARSYSELKGRDCYHTVKKNLEEAARIKNISGFKGPRIKARMVERKGHEIEKEVFSQIWSGIADSVDITPFHTWMNSVEDQRTYTSSIERYPCSLLWYTGIINADLSVSPCCIDYNCAGVIGSLEHSNFYSVWNGREFNNLRRNHLFSEYSNTRICGSCQYWLIKENLGKWFRRKYRIQKASGR
ncbi:MAG: radical SAM protein [Candidatus Riflebacteria bacterium]|nr:radical SAM protein [Candidatus Riflebacteria bacterium]